MVLMVMVVAGDDGDGYHALGEAEQTAALPRRMEQLESKVDTLSRSLDARMDRLKDEITARIDAQFGTVLAAISARDLAREGAAVNGALVVEDA